MTFSRVSFCVVLLLVAVAGATARAETVEQLVAQYQKFNDRSLVTPWLIREYDWVNHPSQSTDRIAVMKKMQELGWDGSGATSKVRESLRSDSAEEKKVAKETIRIINTTKLAGVVDAIDYLKRRFILRTNQGIARLRFDESTVGWKKLKQGRPMVVTFEVGSGYASEVVEGLGDGAGVPMPPGPGGNVPPPWPGGNVRPRVPPPSLNCELSFQYPNPNDKRTGIGVITKVLRGGLAEAKGLRAGDRILRVNGLEIHSLEDYQQAAAIGGGRLELLIQSAADGRTRVVVCGGELRPRR